MSVAACAMLFATSCTNEELVQQEKEENFTLQVSMGVESCTMNDETGVKQVFIC